MKRGEIWWAKIPLPAGKRPVILLSRDESYNIRKLVTIAPITTRIRGIASEISLGPEDGLPRKCVANLDTITTIPKSFLFEQTGLLSPGKMQSLDNAIHFALGLS